MKSVLIIGSIKNNDNIESFQNLCMFLGKGIIKAGYKLVNGGSGYPLNVDKHVAEGAKNACSKNNIKIEKVILCISREGDNNHNIGPAQVVMGDLEVEKRMHLIRKADVVISIGGYNGTKEYLVLAEITEKPIIPIPKFKGVSYEFFNKYLYQKPKYYPESITDDEFELINRAGFTNNVFDSIVNYVINLTLKLLAGSNYIFIASPFQPIYDNVLLAIRLAVKKMNDELGEDYYICERIDEIKDIIRIDEQIEKKIQQSIIVIADVSEDSANVYYEMGFARGIGTNVIPIARQGSKLQFDIKTIRTEFYSINDNKTLDSFANTLKECIANIHYGSE